MSHDEIASRNIVEHYLLGKVSQDESTLFEEHFVDCPVCLDQLEASERLRAALKPLAGDMIRTAPVPTASRGWRSAWPVAAGLILAAGAFLVFAIREARIRGEMQGAVSASLEWQRRYEKEHAGAEVLRGAVPATPLVASTFYLTITRGPDSASEPPNRVTIPSGPQWIVLSLEGEVEAGLKSLRVSIADSAGQEVWRQADLAVTSHESLSAVLPSGVLHRGDYVLTVEGLAPSGRYVAAGHYRFRVAAR